MAALMLLAPASAQAWEMHISITGAGQVTETTSANLVGSGCVTSANNPTGTVGVNCFPGDPAGDYGNLWDVDYVATAKPGYSFVQWQSDGSANPIICDRSSPAATTSTYTGSTCKFRATGNLQTRAVFADTTNPSMASLNGPTAAVNGPAAFTFSATADPTVTGFECRVATVHDWQSCSSGRQENPPSSGSYTFEVRAVDASNNRSGISTWGWTVDKTPPDTSLSSTFADNSIQKVNGATFTFGSNEGGGHFTCQLDSGPIVDPCTSTRSYTGIADGAHTFTVTAYDAPGNADPTPAQLHWTIDTVAPDTTIDPSFGPTEGSSTTATTGEFHFSSSESGGTFECRIDGGSFGGCSGANSHSFAGLSVGQHQFQVRATDQAGNADSSAATRTWTVTAPPVTNGGGTTNTTNTTNNLTSPITQVTPATQTTTTTTTPTKKKAGKCAKLKGKKRAACVKKACKKYKRKRAKYKACTKAVTRRARAVA